MLEVLGYPFFQRALLAGLLVSLLGGALSAFVVQRRLSFLGDGLAHAAFAGVALGLPGGGGLPLPPPAPGAGDPLALGRGEEPAGFLPEDPGEAGASLGQAFPLLQGVDQGLRGHGKLL